MLLKTVGFSREMDASVTSLKAGATSDPCCYHDPHPHPQDLSGASAWLKD
jgi:hypothetical protein